MVNPRTRVSSHWCAQEGQGKSLKRVSRPARQRAVSVESLEGRRLLSGATSGLVADLTQLVFGDVVDGAASAPRTVTIKNSGPTTLTIPAGGVSITGISGGAFRVTNGATSGAVLAPGQSLPLSVTFNAAIAGPQGATLKVTSNDPTATTASVALRGLGTLGEQGSFEPSLQWILDTYQIGVRTGDSDPAESTLDLTPLANDEVTAPLFTKAGAGPVSIVPIAVYSNAASPALTLGYYTKSSPTAGITRKMLYTVPSADVQTLNPRVIGTSSFDPGGATFGLYSTWAAQNNRTVYSEDFRNTFISAGLQRMFKAYPLKNADGSVVPNAYVVGNEEAFNHDYQDAVYIIRNVTPAQSFPAAAPPPQVSGLVLVNADTGKDIGALVDGQTIDLSQIGTSHLSVRAVLSATPGSVKFVDGSFSHVENSAPYTINGDAPGPTYTPWSAPLGANTLTVTPFSASNATGTAGGAMTVNFTVVQNALSDVPNTAMTSTPAASPAPPLVYEAEQAVLGGAVASNLNGGFTGGGYADFQNAAGDTIRWDVAASVSGLVNLTFRYANGGTTNRALALRINGTIINSSLAFNSTDSWTTWKTVTVTVQLTAGMNSIELATTGSNGANFDSLTVG
jgi:hypothetical protein